ncbi:Sodium/proton antiporter [Rhodococcus sp. RD6.2]|uniref:cation:proton antiporter n=1 Tax=Rhodococcus sp. RD6.2 TaxID=260936 RepID=UPI00063B1320|nr:cation:proton antiporter [Rhodococcus sp. RD6.2]CRK54108.1 Sodium/proton antiporter [Rhodococcus sp. RD6.2]
MPSVGASLFWIALCAVVAPIVAGLVPRKLVPEVVLLLIGGMLIGPHMLGLAVDGPEIGLLSELGLGMLFLLAGYEIDTDELTGRGGRRALVTWCTCLALAFLLIGLLGLTGAISGEVAVAIALTSTALGTLLPILKDSGVVNTRIGRTVLNHGAFGELGPVIAMAVLLGSRGTVGSLIVLVVFAAAAVVVGLIPDRVRRAESRLASIIRLGSETTAQTTVRLTILLLVSLGALAAIFEVDGILAAFAAGFILRRAVPAGDEKLEAKLEGLAFGLLIPIFFVTSGMAIDVSAVVAKPGVLVAFLLMILIVRGLPVFVAERFDRGPDGTDEPPTLRQRGQVALYSATGLPLIVAVTGVAVAAGEMSPANASILVAAGAITVLVLPLAASLLGGRAPAQETPAPADQL